MGGDDAFYGLIISLANLYSFVDAADELEDRLKRLEDIIILISIQTTECAIFIKQYAHQRFKSRFRDR